jgi:dolichyl-phosphate beta-glucosyltransferase
LIVVNYRVPLIVPCYNEARRLQVERFRGFLQVPGVTRIIFVDDGSTDATVSVLEALCSGFEHRAHILRCEKNQGKAQAVRCGVLDALRTYDQDFVGYWDADLATPLESVNCFLAVLDDYPEIDMVFGARVKLLGRSVMRKQTRHYLGRIFATVVSQMLHLPIYDTQCGAKLFRVKPETAQAFTEPFISKWVFDVEILARYLKLYGKDSTRLERLVYEYPLEIWEDVGGSKVRPYDFAIAFWDVVRIYRKYLR